MTYLLASTLLLCKMPVQGASPCTGIWLAEISMEFTGLVFTYPAVCHIRLSG